MLSSLSPAVKLYLYRTYSSPILRSGLSTLAIRKDQMEPLANFQRKMLKSCVKVSKFAATPAIHFLTGELPIEGQIHQDVFSLFFNVWTNQKTKIFEITKYLLETSNENSRTWSVYVRNLCKRYGMQDLLTLLSYTAPKKESFMEDVKTKISSYYECELRQKANENSAMRFFNVSLTGLRGRLYYTLNDVNNSRQVKWMIPHTQMLIGCYFTGFLLSKQETQFCPLCKTSVTTYVDSLVHLLVICGTLAEERERLLAEFDLLCHETTNNLSLSIVSNSHEELCQFILDPASMNLMHRVHLTDPALSKFLKLSRDFCFLFDKRRKEILAVINNLYDCNSN